MDGILNRNDGRYGGLMSAPPKCARAQVAAATALRLSHPIWEQGASGALFSCSVNLPNLPRKVVQPDVVSLAAASACLARRRCRAHGVAPMAAVPPRASEL